MPDTERLPAKPGHQTHLAHSGGAVEQTRKRIEATAIIGHVDFPNVRIEGLEVGHQILAECCQFR